LNKTDGPGIQNLLSRSVQGVAAAHNHFEPGPFFHDQRVHLAAAHIREFDVEQGEVDLSVKRLDTVNSLFPWSGKGDALYIFIFSNSTNEYWFSQAIRSPLLAATLAVGTEIPSAAAKWVMVKPSSDVPQ